VKFFGYDFASLGHGIRSVHFFHARIDEAPADSGVFQSHRARRRRRLLCLLRRGARADIFSTPPAMIRSASPLLMARAALATASMLEPQSRLTVPPGTSLGRPCEQQGHAGDVAIVFAGLIGAARKLRRRGCPSRLWRWRATSAAMGDGGEVVGADGGERSARSGRTECGWPSQM